MLAAVLALLSLLAAPPADGLSRVAAAGAAGVDPVEESAAGAPAHEDGCCGADDEHEGVPGHECPPEPCGPESPCPDPGACAACVSCCTRAAFDARAAWADGPEGARLGGGAPEPSPGVGGADPVWHPPRG